MGEKRNSIAFPIAQHNICVSSDIDHALSKLEFYIKSFFEGLRQFSNFLKCFGCKRVRV